MAQPYLRDSYGHSTDRDLTSAFVGFANRRDAAIQARLAREHSATQAGYRREHELAMAAASRQDAYDLTARLKLDDVTAQKEQDKQNSVVVNSSLRIIADSKRTIKKDLEDFYSKIQDDEVQQAVEWLRGMDYISEEELRDILPLDKNKNVSEASMKGARDRMLTTMSRHEADTGVLGFNFLWGKQGQLKELNNFIQQLQSSSENEDVLNFKMSVINATAAESQNAQNLVAAIYPKMKHFQWIEFPKGMTKAEVNDNTGVGNKVDKDGNPSMSLDDLSNLDKASGRNTSPTVPKGPPSSSGNQLPLPGTHSSPFASGPGDAPRLGPVTDSAWTDASGVLEPDVSGPVPGPPSGPVPGPVTDPAWTKVSGALEPDVPKPPAWADVSGVLEPDVGAPQAQGPNPWESAKAVVNPSPHPGSAYPIGQPQLAPMISDPGMGQAQLAPMVTDPGIGQSPLAPMVSDPGMSQSRLAPMISDPGISQPQLAPMVSDPGIGQSPFAPPLEVGEYINPAPLAPPSGLGSPPHPGSAYPMREPQLAPPLGLNGGILSEAELAPMIGENPQVSGMPLEERSPEEQEAIDAVVENTGLPLGPESEAVIDAVYDYGSKVLQPQEMDRIIAGVVKDDKAAIRSWGEVVRSFKLSEINSPSSSNSPLPGTRNPWDSTIGQAPFAPPAGEYDIGPAPLAPPAGEYDIGPARLAPPAGVNDIGPARLAPPAGINDIGQAPFAPPVGMGEIGQAQLAPMVN